MNNTENNSSSSLFIGLILGALVLGGIFLYMRGNGNAAAPVRDSIDANVSIPVRNDNTPAQ